jgi:hypothetical protein
LPDSTSIRTAFEKARVSIAAREQAENLTPSLPTAHFGEAIEKKLDEAQTALSRSRPASAP